MWDQGSVYEELRPRIQSLVRDQGSARSFLVTGPRCSQPGLQTPPGTDNLLLGLVVRESTSCDLNLPSLGGSCCCKAGDSVHL